MNNPTSVRNPGGILVACALAATLSSPVVGQTVPAANTSEPVRLDPVVVSATRTPVDPAWSGSAVTVITGAEIERLQVNHLTGALGAAGAVPIQSGATGATTALYLRGSESDHALFVVDGIRFNDSTSAYFGTLGLMGVSRFDTIEVLRGPQSTLYGADAIGGVISIHGAPGEGAPVTIASVEAGSFGTAGGELATQGAKDAWAYTASVGAFRTENDRANNDFERLSVSTRVQRRMSDTLTLGGTVRGLQGDYESPDNVFVNDPNNEEREANWLGTLFAELEPSPDWSARLTAGAQYRRSISDNPLPNPGDMPPFFFLTDSLLSTSRHVLDGQATYRGWEKHRLTGGFTLEQSEIRGNLAPNDRTFNKAVFLQDEFRPFERLAVTLGGRVDDFETFGTEATGRASVAYHLIPARLKARASYGNGFRAPSTYELFGQFGSNPNLEPERAHGGDAGLDWYLADDRGVLSVSYFENRYEDLIAGFPLVNVNEARSRGVEFSAESRLVGALRARGSYTYLDAKNDVNGQRLGRRPRHAGNVDLWNEFGAGFSAGVGASFVADMMDVDAVTFARIDGEDYVVARAYAAWAVNDRLTLKARVENLFDEEYAPVNGFPALGIGAFGGVEWKF